MDGVYCGRTTNPWSTVSYQMYITELNQLGSNTQEQLLNHSLISLIDLLLDDSFVPWLNFFF